MPDLAADVAVRPGMAERLARMIRVPTVSAERESRGAAPFEAFVGLLAELYPLTHARLERERVGDLGLLFRWPARLETAAEVAHDPLVLMAHFDVVPVDDTDPWTYPPFDGHIADGWVYGRGTLDDKGPLLVILEAVENLLAAGFTPARDVYLAFGGDEEVFGSAARRIAHTLRDRGVVPWLVLDEGGAVVDAPLPFVRGQAAMIGVAEKGALTVRLSARGQGGHASAPPTLTAVRRIARAVDRLGPRTFRPRTSRTIRAMLAAFADRTPGAAGMLYRVLSKTPPVTARILAAVGGEPAALVRTTVAATMQEGGSAANVLPSRASATLNLRLAPGETIAGTVRRIRRRIADAKVAVEIVEGDDPSPESPTDTAPFQALVDAAASAFPNALAVPYVMMQASDARHFHRFAPAVYRFAPLEMSAAQRASIHGVDERVEIASLECGERFHRALLLSLRQP